MSRVEQGYPFERNEVRMHADILSHSGSSYQFVSDGADGIGANDTLFKMTGVTALTDTTLTCGNLTIK